MVTVSPSIAISLLLAIIIVSLLVAWWKKSYESYDKDSFHTFISVLSGLTIFITFAFYYNLITLQEEQQELNSLEESHRFETAASELLNAINSASLIIPSFILSITPLTSAQFQINNIISLADDQITPQTCAEKTTLSYRIFKLWQSYLISNHFLVIDSLYFVTQFLQQANSQLLYDIWTVSKINFFIKSQLFGDLLFEYALPITNQIPSEYTNAAESLISDPRFISIIL